MLFIVIERFQQGAGPEGSVQSTTKLVGERFQQSGRMLPEGVTYLASWMDPAGAFCYQLMEAANPELLSEWTRHWKDLAEFEIVPVVTSAEYWAQAG